MITAVTIAAAINPKYARALPAGVFPVFRTGEKMYYNNILLFSQLAFGLQNKLPTE